MSGERRLVHVPRSLSTVSSRISGRKTEFYDTDIPAWLLFVGRAALNVEKERTKDLEQELQNGDDIRRKLHNTIQVRF